MLVLSLTVFGSILALSGIIWVSYVAKQKLNQVLQEEGGDDNGRNRIDYQ